MSNEGSEELGVDRLKHVRGGNRGAVTKLIKEADTVIYGTSGSRVAVDITAKLSSIEALLVGKQSYLRQLDEQILLQCSLRDIEEEIEESVNLESKIQESIEKIKECKRGNYANLSESSGQSESSNTSSPSVQTSNAAVVNETVPVDEGASLPRSSASVMSPPVPITDTADVANSTVPIDTDGLSPISPVSIRSHSYRSNDIVNNSGIRLPIINFRLYNGGITKFNTF